MEKVRYLTFITLTKLVNKINTHRNDACEAEDLGEKEG